MRKSSAEHNPFFSYYFAICSTASRALQLVKCYKCVVRNSWISQFGRYSQHGEMCLQLQLSIMIKVFKVQNRASKIIGLIGGDRPPAAVMTKFVRDAATSPTVPIIPQQYYCAVTCCANHNCKPSTILKGVQNPYFCPNRNGIANGVPTRNGIANGFPNSYSFSGTSTPYTPTASPHCLAMDNFYSSGHGCFRRAVPTMPLVLALILSLLNLVLPGSGQ